MAGKRFTNIAGGKFRQWVEDQFYMRQDKLSDLERDDNALHFSTNRNAWYKVTSMVNIKKAGEGEEEHPLVKKYGDSIIGDCLAHDFQLQGGVVQRSDSSDTRYYQTFLRSGISRGAFNKNDSTFFGS